MRNLRLNKMKRRVRRAAVKMIQRRRYRALGHSKKGTVSWSVWNLRVGPSGPSEKALARKKAAAARFKGKS